MEHTRIDEGVKRGKRSKYNPPNKRDPDTGKLLPMVSPQVRSELIASALNQIEHGESLTAVALSIGISHTGLRLWMLDEQPAQYLNVQRKGIIARIVHADEELAAARDPLSVARAREAAKFARWDAERRLPRLFGQQTHITVDVGSDLGELLRASRERVIEHDASYAHAIESKSVVESVVTTLPAIEHSDTDQ